MKPRQQTLLSFVLLAAAAVTLWSSMPDGGRGGSWMPEARDCGVPAALPSPSPTAPARLAATEARVPAPSPLPPRSEERTRIVGHVLDETRQPIADARVEALLPPGSAALCAPVVSGVDGAFSLQVPDRTALTLRAESRGHGVASRSPVFGGQEVELVMSSPGKLVVAVIAAPERTPAPGVRIDVWWSDDEGRVLWTSERLSDATGAATFEGAPRAELVVSASLAGRVTCTRIVDLVGGAAATVELELREGLRLSGVVLSAADGLPLAGARVGCEGLGFTSADGRGAFVLEDILPQDGVFGIGATAEGYEPTFQYVRMRGQPAEAALRFELARGAALHGRIVDATGRSVPGARIVALGQQPTQPFTGESLRREAVTGEDGTFVIDSIHPLCSWSLAARSCEGAIGAARAGPFPSTEKELDAGSIVVTAPASLVGTLEGAGDRSNSASVGLRPIDSWRGADASGGWIARVRLDPWGEFRFESIPAGNYLIEVFRSPSMGAQPPLATLEAELLPGVTESVRLRQGANAIRGRVSNGGRGLPGGAALTFVALDEKGRIAAHGAVEGDGTFECAVASTEPHSLIVRDASLLFEEERVERVLPDGSVIEVRLRPRVGGASLRGFVLRSDGQPAENVFVSFTDAETSRRVARVAIPDGRGAFELGALEDKPYLVEIMDPDGRYRPQAPRLLAPDGDPLEITITPR